METDFQKTGEFGNIVKLERAVDTPMIDGSEKNYGEGRYFSERNRHVVYETEQYHVEVIRVSNRGWNVRRYDEDGMDGRRGYFEDEQEAHAAAREMLEEVLADE